jgi:quinol monooxygenase YgiN
MRLEETLRELARETRNEPGSLVYEVHRSASERDEYLVYEIWRSQAHLDAHMKGAALEAFLQKVTELVNGAYNLRLFEPVDIARA